MYSLTQGGNLTVLAGFISLMLKQFKVEIPAEEIVQAVSAVMIAVGLVMSWTGRARRGDLTPLGFRKNIK